MQQFLALSVVAPNGTRIAQGIKTFEVRSWVPAQLPLKDLFMFGETMRFNLPVPPVGVKDILLGF